MNEQNGVTIDLLKLTKHLLKYFWIILLCAAIGFGAMYIRTKTTAVDTYTATATLYVNNGNPNMVNYAYTNEGDLSTAVQLLDTYKVIINSNKVMDSVIERLNARYPGITAEFVISTLSINSVNETGVMRLSCTTSSPQLSADVCNAVVDVAPQEIIRVVGAGSLEVVDYATVPQFPNRPNLFKTGLIGGLAGAVLAGGLLVLLFLLNTRVRDAAELKSNYICPILSEIPRTNTQVDAQWQLLIDSKTPAGILEAYNKLRMNLGFSMMGKRQILLLSSAAPGEGKSTITANLALTYARGGKRVLLIDGDMRRANQTGFFFELPKEGEYFGLSNLIIGETTADQVINREVEPNLDVLLAGSIPPNPSELLSSERMSALLRELETQRGYDLIIMDMPPINLVPDPLILAGEGVSLLYVVRQNYSDHRSIRAALSAVELAKMDLLGMVFYGEKVNLNAYTRKGYGKSYGGYYGQYDKRSYGDISRSAGGSHSKWELRSPDNQEKTGAPGKQDEAPAVRETAAKNKKGEGETV